jgi:uroporphyrinogen-III synthase
MTRPILVLRPQPGADATAGRARDRGLEAIVAPLFRIVHKPWLWPEAADALLVTSANAARCIDARPDRRLPVYAVGEATALALRAEGFTDIRTGASGVEEIVRRAAAEGTRALLHLCGEDRTSFNPGLMRIEQRVVYAAEPIQPDPAFAEALRKGAVALLHSVRAARRFRELAGTGHRIAAISAAVLDAAGSGWAAAGVADRPQDDALLAAAARLCH